MITGISIENFKGIRERVEIELRPLTLLFGANSAGKSSILHALHYAREIFERHNLDADQTIAGGKYLDLGGFRRLVHRNDDDFSAIADSPIRLRMDVDLSRNDLKSYYPEIDRLIETTIVDIDRYRDDIQSTFEDIRLLLSYRFGTLFNDITTAAVELEIGWSNTHNCPYIVKNTIYLENEPFIQLEANPQLRGVAAKFSVSTPDPQNPGASIEVSTLNHKCLKRVRDLSQKREESPSEDQSLIEILLDQCGKLLSFHPNQIDLDELADALPPLDESLNFTPSMISPTGESEHDTRHAFHINLAMELVRALSQYIVGPCQVIRDQLKQSRYLGPLRETIPRNYAAPRFPEPARWASGLGAWDALDAGNDALIEAVGSWLGDEDKLNSGCSIERRTMVTFDYSHPLIRKMVSGRAFDDIEHDWSLNLSETQLAARIVVVGDSGIELHPHEVGIGISQVVPVIVTALDGTRRTIVIEQPELHLHPKLQAELADLFIEAAKGKAGHTVLLETHSELIPLRLMRRIRETFEQRNQERLGLAEEDVAIYYVEQFRGATVVTRLTLSERGKLLDPWPEGFFEEGYRERFAD